MHDGEVDIGVPLVRRLLRSQLPEHADLAIEPVRSTGTVNAIFRLGDELCVRMPRVERWSGDLAIELEWLPKLAPHLPLAVPEPVAEGGPQDRYPFRWAVFRWIDGDTFATDRIRDQRQAATDLAAFVADLRQVDPSGAPTSRSRPLRRLDVESRAAIAAAQGIDTEAVTAAWVDCLRAPEWDGAPVWRHGDLLPPNLLLEDGRLTAVIDFGGAGAGDPALDVIPAWWVFDQEGRSAFREALDVDDGTWARARALALNKALVAIPYYPDTNPGFVALARRALSNLLNEHHG